MKKMLRIAAALAALLAMTNFIGCKNDDDDESGNGLENTYWATEDVSTDVVENVSLTLRNGMYVHIEDSSKGSVYGADIENLDYSTLDFTKTNSVDISYSSEKQSFTYVVDGSKITVTSKYTDEDGKEQTEIFEATLATDKKSFTTTEINDGKEVSVTYTRIDKAPANATLVITVAGSDVAVTEVKITSTVTEVTAGESITLTAEVSPADATNKTVTWTSSNESVATVDSTGKVTGVVAGTATITAKAGEKTAAVDVTVKAAATSGGETGGSGSGETGGSTGGTTGGSTGGETGTTKVLDVVYDLTTGLPSDFPTTADTVVSADWAAPTAAPETNDITWTWVATSTRKVKNNGGLQVSNGSSAEDMITLSADSDFTVTVTYKFAGAYAADKVRCISVGDKSDSMASDTDKTKEYTLTTTAAKTATIAMNGMKLIKVETKAAN